MHFKHWAIGLDIQPDQITAVAIRKRRQGWQLCHWWQHAVTCQNSADETRDTQDELVELLRYWQTLLPSDFSLRVGLPPHLVLNRCLTIPQSFLREPLLGRYVGTAARQWFPEGSGALALDYQPASEHPDKISITVASQAVLGQWRALFRRAGLRPDVFELMPGCLAVALSRHPATGDRILVHVSDTFWMWACYRQGELSHGWQFRQQCPDAATLCLENCPDAEERYFCGTPQQSPPAGFRVFQPFSSIPYCYPPLPVHENAFTIATGLAFRQEDRL